MTTDVSSRSVPLAKLRSRAIAARLGVAVVAAAYVGYLALLVTCDLRRVAPLGFIPLFEPGRVVVGQLQADSIGARAGLQTGDRLRRANGQVLEGSGDWQRVRVHLDPSNPLDLEIERAGRSFAVSLLLPAGLHEWRTGPARPALLAFRLAQVITLGFALVVAFKRYSQPSALFGAVLLASLATLSLALPMRMVAFWHALPPVFATLLWVPFATSVAVGPLMFAFFAVFPRRVLSTTRLTVAVFPAVLIVGWHVYAWHSITQDLGPPTGLADWLMGVFAINVIYAGFAVALLMAHWRSVDTLTDQRRIRVLIAGAVLGVAFWSGARHQPLAQSRDGYFCHAHAHGAVIGVPRRSSVVRLRDPPSPVV